MNSETERFPGLDPVVREYINGLEEALKTNEAEWEERYERLVDEYRLLLYKRFGRSGERIDVTQQLLFDEGEGQPVHEEDNATVPVRPHSRKKVGRKPLDEKLPREEIIHDIPEEEKICACGHRLVKIGEEVSERLQVIPEQIYVERHLRPKYACRFCEGSGDEEKAAVRIAPAVPSIIPKSIVTPGLLAFLFVNKYIDHLPFYRQEKRFERIGITISRQDMSNWQGKVYTAVKPLLELMKGHLKTGPVMRMDETTVQVLKEPDREDTRKSYMWLASGGPPGEPVYVYEYRETRGAKHIHEFLEGFSGYLQTDGYEGYNAAVKAFPDVLHVGCFAHARRKFYEASKISKKAGKAEEGLKRIARLYAIERTFREEDMSEDAFMIARKEAAEPVLTDLKLWLEKSALQVPPQTLIGKAVTYTLKEWDKLIRYLESPYLTPDNNACENAIRPFVLGRKNWLFSGSPKGAMSSCCLYSLIETAKANDLNPYVYLSYLFERVPRLNNAEDWISLLPWNLDLPPSHH